MDSLVQLHEVLLFLSVFIFIGVAIIMFALAQRAKPKNHFQEGVVPDMLARAELRVKEIDTSKWVIVKNFNSSSGFTEKDLVNLMIEFSAQNISANYQSLNVGIEGGAAVSWVVKAPLEQVDEAKALIERFLT